MELEQRLRAVFDILGSSPGRPSSDIGRTTGAADAGIRPLVCNGLILLILSLLGAPRETWTCTVAHLTCTLHNLLELLAAQLHSTIPPNQGATHLFPGEVESEEYRLFWLCSCAVNDFRRFDEVHLLCVVGASFQFRCALLIQVVMSQTTVPRCRWMALLAVMVPDSTELAGDGQVGEPG